MRIKVSCPPLASIPESYEINAIGRSSDLLPEFLPSHLLKLNSDLDWKTVKELTAAGQLRTYTIFPFNLHCNLYNQEPKALQMYQKISLRQKLLS
jgi:hypothetical protein